MTRRPEGTSAIAEAGTLQPQPVPVNAGNTSQPDAVTRARVARTPRGAVTEPTAGAGTSEPSSHPTEVGLRDRSNVKWQES